MNILHLVRDAIATELRNRVADPHIYRIASGEKWGSA
jgi:hypothetical protein